MENCPLRPYFSTLLKTASPFKAKEPHIEFGKNWRELLLPIRAIRIKFSKDLISSIKNIAADDIVRLGLLGQFAANDRTSIFQLIDDEMILRTEVRAGKDYAHAIRFHTNKRVSLWIGQAKGVVREIVAPEGYALHSFYGTWGDGLREIGALVCPLTVTVPPLETIKNPLLVDCPVLEGDYRMTFTVSTMEIGAVVMDASLKWIHVLSRRQVEDLTVLLDGVYSGQGEHWLMLLDKEHVTTVEILHDRTVVKGMRWTTTLQTTPWIGQHPIPTLELMQYSCNEHEQICGFYGARGREGIATFGVLSHETSTVGDAGWNSDEDESSTTSDSWDVLQRIV